MLGSIAVIIRGLVGHGTLYFDTPLKVKTSPASETVCFWAASVSPKGEVFVMDGEEEWYQVEQNEKGAQIMEVLFHRVRFLNQLFASKSQEVAL